MKTFYNTQWQYVLIVTLIIIIVMLIESDRWTEEKETDVRGTDVREEILGDTTLKYLLG